MTARSPARPWAPRRPTVVVASVVLSSALMVSACGVPLPAETAPAAPAPPQSSGATVDPLVPIDDGSATLRAQLDRIAARAGEVLDVLEEVAVIAARQDGAPDAVRALGDDAVGLLLGRAAGGTGAGLLPAIEPDRGGTATDDMITDLITQAGDVGGERSRLVLELIRDPLVGVLGAWQRDPVGVIMLLRDIAAAHAESGEGPDALDAALLAIPGELTRALGYALVIADTDDLRLAAHAAERGTGHLVVIIIAIELAVERIGAS